MVTATRTRKIVSLPDVKAVLEKYGIPEKDELMNELNNLPRKRLKAPAPPKGGIGIRAAGKKYGVHFSTIQKWVKRGIVPIILVTDNWTYVDENSIKLAIKNSHRLSI